MGLLDLLAGLTEVVRSVAPAAAVALELRLDAAVALAEATRGALERCYQLVTQEVAKGLFMPFWVVIMAWLSRGRVLVLALATSLTKWALVCGDLLQAHGLPKPSLAPRPGTNARCVAPAPVAETMGMAQPVAAHPSSGSEDEGGGSTAAAAAPVPPPSSPRGRASPPGFVLASDARIPRPAVATTRLAKGSPKAKRHRSKTSLVPEPAEAEDEMDAIFGL
jgi:hypothetical protein